MFKTIAFVEERQWEVIGLRDYLQQMKDDIGEIPKFNPHSNVRFMEEARNNNVLLDSLLDFLVLAVPLTLMMWFLYYHIFYCLFHYEVSKFLRPYSFGLILLDLLLQGNLEYFTFLVFRSLDVFFSYSIVSTFFKVFTVLFMFLLLGCTIGSYWGYYYQYIKLARYFLSNMYRFKSSYLLMTVTFGLRPFLKGFIHAEFF